MTDRTDAPRPGRVLIIAGSDSGGAAGIQADIKSVTANGGFAMTAVTAITVQDTTAVHGVWPVPVDAVIGQMTAVLRDLGADQIKTGMLGTAHLVEAVAETLDAEAKDIGRVIDPVMVASSGARLMDQQAIGAIISDLIPQAALVTPNAIEAEILTSKPVESVDGQRRAAEALLERGAKAALVKGGHVEGDVMTDVLQSTDGEWMFENKRLDTKATHGTGCTLASSTAALLAQHVALPEAVERAVAYLHGAIRNAPNYGAGHGPVDHGWRIRNAESE